MQNKNFLIPDNKKEVIFNCLNHIEQNATVNTDGQPAITMDVFIDFANEILCEYLPIEENFPERTKKRIVFSALMRWLKYKRTNNPQKKINLFIQALKYEIKNIQKRKSRYRVLMFLNIAPLTIGIFSQVTILGETLKFISWQDVHEMDISGLWREVKIHDRNNPILWDVSEPEKLAPHSDKFTPILYEVNTYGPEAAIELASDRIDLLRAIINTPSALGSYTYFRSQPGALSKVLPSPIFVFFSEEGKRISVYHTIEKFNYNQIKLSQDRISSIQYLLSKVSSLPAPHCTWAFLINVLHLYQRALDTTTTEAAYLTMWQVLENCIGLGEELTRNKGIQSRIISLLQADSLTREIIDIIVDKRNKLVHSGEFLEDGDRLFFILKLLTDSIIRRFINLADQYPTLSELKEYVSLISLGDGVLERKQSVIGKIIEERRIE